MNKREFITLLGAAAWPLATAPPVRVIPKQFGVTGAVQRISRPFETSALGAVQ